MRIDFEIYKKHEPELIDLIALHADKNNLTHSDAAHDLLRELMERKLNPEYGLLTEYAGKNV